MTTTLVKTSTPCCIDWPTSSRRRTSSARNRLAAVMMNTNRQFPEQRRSISLCFGRAGSRDKLPEDSYNNSYDGRQCLALPAPTAETY